MGNSPRNGCYNRCGNVESCCCEGASASEIIHGYDNKVIQTEPSISAGKLLFPSSGSGGFAVHPTNGFQQYSPREGGDPQIIAGRGNETVLLFDDGSKYIGQIENGYRHGYGEWLSTTEHYVGQWKRDHRDGEGHLTWPDGRVYRGQLEMGKFNGTGRMEWPTSQGTMVFEGQYVNQLRHGSGRYIWSDGRVYTGTWVRGKRWGTGTFFNSNGEQRKGVWRYSKLDGSPDKLADGYPGSSPQSEATEGLTEGTEELPKQELTTNTWDSWPSNYKGDHKSDDSEKEQEKDQRVDKKESSRPVYSAITVSEDTEIRTTAEVDAGKLKEPPKKLATRRSLAKEAQLEALKSARSPDLADSNSQLGPPDAFSGSRASRRKSSKTSLDKSNSIGKAESNASASRESTVTSASSTEQAAQRQADRKATLQEITIQIEPKGKPARPVKVHDTDTCEALREQIQRLGISEQMKAVNYRLCYKGQYLSLGLTLGFYGIKDGDTVTIQPEEATPFGY